MGSYNGTRLQSISFKTREPEDDCTKVLATKLGELHKTNEELKQAKDDAMESWLDSKPLIDKLEMLKKDLADANNQCVITDNTISDLESQLETTNTSIKSKKEEEHKIRTKIDKIIHKSDETRAELERVKLEADEERRSRLKLKQVLRLRKQTLRTLQLTLRAIRLESEAFNASAAEAMNYIKLSNMENTTIQLPHDKYYELTRRAKEETSMANWRVSVSAEQKLAAEESRHSSLRRLKEVQSKNRSMKKKTIEREAGEDSRNSVRPGVKNGHIDSPKALGKLISEPCQGNPQQQLKRSKCKNNKTFIKKKKPTIFVQIRTFLVRKITKLFG